MGLKTKGETADELAAAVRAALRHARAVPGLSGPRIDTCGTGGDGTCSFNCSTANGSGPGRAGAQRGQARQPLCDQHLR
jgi:anthranilate phosphoribosyltransferase